MKDGDKHLFFPLLFLDLKVPFRFKCFSNTFRRRFSVNTSVFFFYLDHILCTMKVERPPLQAGELRLPGQLLVEFPLAWLRHSRICARQLQQAGVHGAGIAIRAEVNSVIPGHCSEKKQNAFSEG